jgi:hypothetical protein
MKLLISYDTTKEPEEAKTVIRLLNRIIDMGKDSDTELAIEDGIYRMADLKENLVTNYRWLDNFIAQLKKVGKNNRKPMSILAGELKRILVEYIKSNQIIMTREIEDSLRLLDFLDDTLDDDVLADMLEAAKEAFMDNPPIIMTDKKHLKQILQRMQLLKIPTTNNRFLHRRSINQTREKRGAASSAIMFFNTIFMRPIRLVLGKQMYNDTLEKEINNSTSKIPENVNFRLITKSLPESYKHREKRNVGIVYSFLSNQEIRAIASTLLKQINSTRIQSVNSTIGDLPYPQ